jgi:uncharacterized protein (DUF58 family)
MWWPTRWSGSRRSEGGVIGARATLVLAVGSAFAAAAFDSPSLYVPGLALALLVVVSRIWVTLAARHARIERERGPWSIAEGEPYHLLATVHAGRIPLPGGRVVHPLALRPIAIGARVPRRVMLEVPSLPRGRHTLEPVALELSDPFRICTAIVRTPEGEQVLVLPRIEPVVTRPGTGANGIDGGEGLDGVGSAGLDTRAIDFEIDGTRPYRDGSPASRIHWPTVARIGQVVEHRLVAGADSSPLVVLDSSSPDDDEALDRAVRAAASLCVHLAPRGGCALLLAGERRPREIDPLLRTWPQTHALLALIEAGGAPPILSRTSAARAETVFWVTASSTASPDVGRAAGYVVAPAPAAARAPFTVAGCAARRLGAAGAARRVRAA